MSKFIKDLLACIVVSLLLSLVMTFILISWAEHSYQENIIIAEKAKEEQARLIQQSGGLVHLSKENAIAHAKALIRLSGAVLSRVVFVYVLKGEKR